ncbi:site-specific DNA-methyltransferase [Gemmiger sp.]
MPTLDWIGKDKVINHHQDVPYRVLERQYSFDKQGQHTEDNGSEKMVIHGDNLEALKSLLPRYEGKVKCIYIDPPYNTGNEGWVYNDNVNDPKIKKWLGEVVGKEGEDLSRHDKWLCMMYPRLKLLYKLLADDGAIFISIDDNEVISLKAICNEIFGARNYITNFIWRKVDSPNDNKVSITPDHEYIVTYAKNISHLFFSQKPAPEIVDAYKQIDENGKRCRDRLLKKNGKNSLRRDRPTMFFPIVAPDGTEVFPVHDNGEEARWAMGKDGVAKQIEAGTLVWKRRNRNGTEVWEPYTREYAPEIPTRPYPSIWADLPTMRQAKAVLREIFQTADLFDTPKPSELIERLLQMTGGKDSLILDSFAGSGTTAHAVLNMNKADGGNRKFILIEMMDYADSITAERVKRVIQGYGEDKKAVPGTGGSFSYYELGKPLMNGDNLNEEVGLDKIREYIWYTETKADFREPNADKPYYLGSSKHTAYYFFYKPDKVCVLNHEFLSTITVKQDNYVIYADRCAISAEDLQKFGIIFKKIPRDITLL